MTNDQVIASTEGVDVVDGHSIRVVTETLLVGKRVSHFIDGSLIMRHKVA